VLRRTGGRTILSRESKSSFKNLSPGTNQPAKSSRSHKVDCEASGLIPENRRSALSGGLPSLTRTLDLQLGFLILLGSESSLSHDFQPRQCHETVSQQRLTRISCFATSSAKAASRERLINKRKFQSDRYQRLPTAAYRRCSDTLNSSLSYSLRLLCQSQYTFQKHEAQKNTPIVSDKGKTAGEDMDSVPAGE
jgi:hypothetical protein